MHGRISQALTVIVVSALLVSGCTSEAFNIGMAKDKENTVVDTGFSVSTAGSYDSADTAVVMGVDQENNCVIFMNMDAGRQYTLYYDGTTYVTDKHDGPMTISQIRAGDVVDVNFLKGKRQIASIKQSPDAWVYEKISNYDLGGLNKTASIGSSTYSLPDEAVILSEGKRVEAMEVVAQDLVTIRGIDHEIYSVSVERGHGYLRLRNEQALIGGWIEVGNTVIREITEDMLLVVPEGSYQVALSNGGVSSTKDIVIERDRETVLDVGDIEIVQNKTGRILFDVTPGNAKVTIDGTVTDISKAVELPYGIHQISLEAEGYDSLTKYIQVGSEYAKISFELEKKAEDTPSVSQNGLEEKEPEKTTIPELEYAPVKDPAASVSENTLSPTKSNKVYIDSPKGVEVYVDGNYVGIAPVSFKKNIGSHTVTLKKSGYKNKSYTIYLYNDGEDITYSFTDLEKEEEKKDPGSVSGNDVSSNNSTSTSSGSSSTETPNPPGGNEGTTSSSSSTETPNPPGGNEGTTSSSGGTEIPNPPGGNEGTTSSDSTGNESGDGEGTTSGGSTGNESGDGEGTTSGGSTGNESGDGEGTTSGGSTGNESGDGEGTTSGGSTGNESGDGDQKPGGNDGDSGQKPEGGDGGSGQKPETGETEDGVNETQFNNITGVLTGKANSNFKTSKKGK